MNVFAPREAARAAVSAHADRAATAVVHDSADARLVVFRIAAGQAVPPHRSPSTVILSVISGSGTISGQGTDGPDERHCSVGDVVAFAPDELHGMRAMDEELVVLATITPRPGSR